MVEIEERALPEFLAKSADCHIWTANRILHLFGKSKPYVPVKSVLATVFLWQRGKDI